MYYGRQLPHCHPDISEATFNPQTRLPERLADESACPTAQARQYGEGGRHFYPRWLKGATARQGNVILGRDESFDHIVRYVEPVSARLAGESACPT